MNYTLGELVDACAPANDEHRAVWLRRARELSNLQILRPVKRQRKGSGRHRLFKSETRLLAAVLLRMTDQRAPIRCLQVLAELVEKPARSKNALEFKQF